MTSLWVPSLSLVAIISGGLHARLPQLGTVAFHRLARLSRDFEGVSLSVRVGRAPGAARRLRVGFGSPLRPRRILGPKSKSGADGGRDRLNLSRWSGRRYNVADRAG